MTPDPGAPAWAVARLAEALGGDPPPGAAAALGFAHAAHAGQARLARPGIPVVPYLTHPVEVAAAVAGWAATAEVPLPPVDDLVTAALLHDTIEDCGVSAEEITARFGPDVARLVTALTKPRLRTRESAAERARRFARQIAAAGPPAVLLKCCDLMHNVAEVEATPPDVLRRAIDRGRAYYLPLLDEVPVGGRFRAHVVAALDRADAVLAAAAPAAAAGSAALKDLLARAGGRKTEAHDAAHLLQQSAGGGWAVVVRFPVRGEPVVVAGDPGGPPDPGRWTAARAAVLDRGGVGYLKPKGFRTAAAGPGGVGTVIAAVDTGFDGTDTLLVWLLPPGWVSPFADAASPETVLRLVLAAVVRPAAARHAALAREALGLGLELDLGVATDLGLEPGQLGQLVRWRRGCELACSIVEGEFRTFLHTRADRAGLWHRVRVESRVKTCASILGKFARQSRAAWPDFTAVDDIAGVRVVCPTAWHVERVVEFLSGSAAERPMAGPVKRFDREPTPQGYRGVHAVRAVRLPGGAAPVPCEVQVRTVLQDAWATLSHTVAYKAAGGTARPLRDALRKLGDGLAECERAATAIFDQPDPSDAPAPPPDSAGR